LNVACVVDGFNVYHSICDLRARCGHDYRWLDVKSLCESHLHLVGGGAQVGSVGYFSAFATHLRRSDSDKLARHRLYVAALKSTGVRVHLGRFKRKDVIFSSSGCRVWLRRHEEKETDVAMAVRLVESAASGACAALLLVSGDTDLAPALRAARSLAPDKPILALFPFRRANRDLARLCSASFKLSEKSYAANQLPDVVVLGSGKEVRKPAAWH